MSLDVRSHIVEGRTYFKCLRIIFPGINDELILLSIVGQNCVNFVWNGGNQIP
jgi:hypothetical protein